MFVFDFDGVLFDSIDEILLSAYNSISGNLLDQLDKLPSGYEELFKFTHCRARNAAEIVVSAKWSLSQLGSKPRLLSADEFNSLVLSESQSKEELQSAFFAARSKLQAQSPESWLSLTKPYEPLFSALKQGICDSFAIITNKNYQAVVALCDYYGLPVPREQIYSGDQHRSKAENFRSLRESVGGSDYAFIDDSLNNLIELQEEFTSDELTLYFASWGYVAPEESEQAAARGITVINQDGLINQLRI